MILLRSAVFNAFFFILTFVLAVLASIVRFVSPHHVLWFGQVWARCLVAGARILCGINLRVEGLEQIPEGGVLIASRHQSAFDTFVWLMLMPRCCYVLKHELLRIPLFGGLIIAAGMIPVDRSAGSGAIRALLRAGEIAARDQRQIVIFPEGTRSDYGRPRPLQPGIAALASKTGLPVVPVATDSGLCWGRRAFRKRPGTIRIVIGAPVPAQTERGALMRLLEREMGALDEQPVPSGRPMG
ncbi:MAG TPA: lysophospholipid acyltransferase family protein [Rhodopila sp.]|nr:lysophospholipid acyltransferase family protein [Rhodopila sp.]